MKNQWRTVIGILAIGLMLLGAEALTLAMHDGDVAKGIFSSACMTFGALGLGLCGKAVGEHATNGDGLAGMVKNIVTDSKPGTPPATPVP